MRPAFCKFLQSTLPCPWYFNSNYPLFTTRAPFHQSTSPLKPSFTRSSKKLIPFFLLVRLYTDHGTIIGHSSNIVPPKIKSLAALSSFTWRRHKESLELAQRTAPDIQRMKTLRLIHKKDKPDPDLKTMIVEWDGLTAAIEEVKARCLIAAIKDSTYFEGEGDPYGKQISALSLARKGRSTGSNDNATAVIGAASNVDKEEAATTSGSTITTSGEAINVGSSASSGGDDKYVKKAEGGGSGVDGDDDALKELKELGLTKIDALMLRAEALAEAVAEDWIGEVPQGFY